MAESEVLHRRAPSRSSWLRVRKARPHLLLSRRGRRRFGVLTRVELRRLRRRLLRAHALGGDWKQVAPAGAHVAVKCKLRARSRPAPRSPPTPSVPPAPCTASATCSLLNPRYHILTPLPPEELKTVNCLLVGSISIPHCIFQNQPGPEGSVPYVTTDYNLNIPGATEKIGEREYGKAFPRHKLRQRRK